MKPSFERGALLFIAGLGVLYLVRWGALAAFVVSLGGVMLLFGGRRPGTSMVEEPPEVRRVLAPMVVWLAALALLLPLLPAHLYGVVPLRSPGAASAFGGSLLALWSWAFLRLDPLARRLPYTPGTPAARGASSPARRLARRIARWPLGAALLGTVAAAPVALGTLLVAGWSSWARQAIILAPGTALAIGSIVGLMYWEAAHGRHARAARVASAGVERQPAAAVAVAPEFDEEREKASTFGTRERVRCPCCGHPTLAPPYDTVVDVSDHSGSVTAVCPLCDWEVEWLGGRGRARPGDNGGLSLQEARANVRRFLTIYDLEHAERWPWLAGGPTPRQRAAEQAMLEAYDAMARQPDGYYRADLWDVVDEQVRVLQRETERQAEGEEQADDQEPELPPADDNA